jgi:hypothetical protein
MIQMQNLNICCNKKITDEGIKYMIQIQNLKSNNKIYDTNEKLNLVYNNKITDKGIK